MSRHHAPHRLGSGPPEVVVHDELVRCPYLEQRTARLPLRFPLRRLTGAELDDRLAHGDRRNGPFLYRPACPACRACELLRIPVAEFAPSRSQRRAARRAGAVVEVERDRVEVSPEHVALFNRHRDARGLARAGERPIDAASYRAFLVDTCCDGFELRYRVGGRLVGLAITDRGRQSLSAVYTCFDPGAGIDSLGVFSILTQIAVARAEGLRHLYLGFAIEGCPSMAYKTAYMPHERLIGGTWQPFRRRG